MIAINADALEEELFVSAINPFERSEVEVHVQGTKEEKFSFSLLCSHDSRSDQLFDFGAMRVRVLMASQAIQGNRSPFIRICAERGAVVHNLTDLAMDLRVSCPVTKQESGISVNPSEEQQVGISSKEKFVVIVVGVRPSSLLSAITSDDAPVIRWSSQVRLLTEGDAKPCIIPFQQAGASSLAGSYVIELKKDEETIRISICPQVVVLNSTVSML